MSGSPQSLKFSYLTLFPEQLKPHLSSSLLEKASEKGILDFHVFPLRSYATDKHRRVDDAPYGGGGGMLLKADVLHSAWRAAQEKTPGYTVLLSPQGKILNRRTAQRLARQEHLILVCGHYEGVDERFVDLCVDEEVSIGNFVLSGGELPALVLTEVVSRWVPGVVGNADSVSQDSLEAGSLKFAQYTRPLSFEGLPVPPILVSGHHAQIETWRCEQRNSRTRRKRPDLWRALEGRTSKKAQKGRVNSRPK